MFITLISCGIFAYAVNVVGSIIQSYQELNYLDFVHEINREEDENLGGEVLNKVSENLKNEVLQEYYLRILQNNLTLSQYLSQEMINALAIRMKEKIIGPQELLFKQGEIDDRVIFLVKGKLQIIYTREIYNHLQKFQKVREHSLANCYQIDYAPIPYLTITKKFNHILEKNSEYNYQKRDIKYIRDQFREKNFFHPYFDFHNINFYLRKYRVENALKIEYQDEEFEKDFYQFVDREFLCSVPQIPQYDEGIRLKYIEANFVNEFIDEENPQESSCQDFELTDEDFEKLEANLVYENIHTEPLEMLKNKPF
ncbi:Cyclic nucleotide-binding protein [Pseudocohnilembus persalinus]|uniref:Cyclic nucleotide-binding protein n=1 Tax=Pseudocohnilembus persalinus TaxID=266149 RepID=A0A0V0QIP9_PSEPJ|nr:Cyclic nucleotide-binding protein [Pseudocohnilembus persalinus]|eukprot:KRX02175.1 Cyclic nucleotide-binding protein [Pseudocohnilembus persalinus]